MSEKFRKFPALDGLRGIAALIVVFDHLYLLFFVEMDKQLAIMMGIYNTPAPISKAVLALFNAFHDGNFAVWVFWVMSAFVLSVKYFQLNQAQQDGKSREYLFKGAAKRYVRLSIPILASSIIAYLLLSVNWMTHTDLYARLGDHTSHEWLPTFYNFEPSFPAALKTSLWDAFFDFNRKTTYNTILWTMEPEFFGSLFLFAFLSLFGARRIRFIAYPMIVGVLYFRGTHWLNAFVFGILLCDTYVNSSLFLIVRKALDSRFVQMVLAAGIAVLIGAPNYGGVFHLVVAIILVALCLSLKWFEGFLSAKLPTYLGKISFSLYLIHVPILCSATGFFYRTAVVYFDHPIAALLSSLATIILSVAAADIFYRYVDLVAIQLSATLANRITQLQPVQPGSSNRHS